ncbi:Polyamine transporter 4 [Alternaria alternata]|nr:Polyamine transporter 4 [Alternaria alternata]
MTISLVRSAVSCFVTIPCFFARFFRIIGLYVSLIGKAMMYTNKARKRMHHWVHFQVLYCATNPPTTGFTYPIEGPAKGAIKNKLVVRARLCGGYRSAFVPAPTASPGLPARPAKNRHMIRLA